MITRRMLVLGPPVIALGACAGGANVPRVLEWTDLRLDETEALTRVNTLRAETELAPLTLDPILSLVTRQYSQALASARGTNSEFAGNLKSLLAAQGYPHDPAAVLFAFNRKSPAEVLDGWLDAAVPGEGLLTEDLIHMAIAGTERKGDDTYYLLVMTRPAGAA